MSHVELFAAFHLETLVRKYGGATIGVWIGKTAYQHYGGTNMARGTAIGDVTNVLKSDEITGNEKIPAMLSSEQSPQVVTTKELKEYINEGVQEDEEMTFNEIDECINF